MLWEMSKFLNVEKGSPPSPVFPINVRGNGGQSTPGGCNKATSKKETFLVRMEEPRVNFREKILQDTFLY